MNALRRALARLRSTQAALPGKRSAAACAAGALGAAIAGALIAPLALAGQSPRAAAELFAEDLARFRAAPADLRAAPFACAAAAAYEDRAFLRRPSWAPPLSPTGTLRALYRNLRGIPEGGSTIPQQLAKLYLRGEGRAGALDKLREALFATWLVRNAARDEVAGLYLNLSAGAAIGRERLPEDGLNRLSLALFGLPLKRLSREDQLTLGAVPRGVGWLRDHPSLSARRIASARQWLIGQGLWDASARSYLDEPVDGAAAFRFVEGWTERLASGVSPSADLDLVQAVDAFRDGLSRTLFADYPGTSVRTAFAALGAGGAVLARSGAEAALMPVNYGSVAKLEALSLAVEAFGPHAVRELTLPPAPCVRWTWATKERRRAQPASFCPSDVARPDHAMSLDEAVARSINTMTVRHALLLPPLLWQRRPDLAQQVFAAVPAAERAALDSPADRGLAAGLLAQLGEALPPELVPAELSYSAASVAFFRFLKERRERAGLPSQRLPDDPTSLLGNSSRATAEQMGAYLHARLFAGDGTCLLSDTGALLALRRREGTLRWLAQRWPKLVFAGKTGSSPHDDGAVAAIGLCLDSRPVVLVAALRPVEGALPAGLHGSLLLRGLDAYLKALSALERKPTPALLPAWVEEEIAERAAAHAPPAAENPEILARDTGRAPAGESTP
jgi:hypothetical protein